MKSRFASGMLLSLCAAACSSDPAAEPAAPPVFVPTPGPFIPGLSPSAVRGAALPVTGHLDGELHGITLSADTTDNSGGYEVWESGGGYMQLNIAAATPEGAGMLIVGFSGTALQDTLAIRHWSSATAEANAAGAAVVSSCAGPVLGEWPFELPANDAEMTVGDDPERPGGVVLVVKGQFPASHLGADATSELVGTFRFDRPDMVP